jgi:3-deoxy-D-manno-octulosonic-acid transferase
MPAPSLFYRAIAFATRAVLPLVALGSARGRMMLRERRDGMARLQSSAAGGEGSQPTIVMHGASAGELRQLEPVLRRLRERHPRWRIIVTWFSTSGRAVAETFPADLALPLPFDTARETGRWLELARPAIIVIGKLDLWPELAWQAERRGIPVVLIAATVRESSGRLTTPARQLLQPAYQSLAAVGAVSAGDADRLAVLGVPPDRIRVTGDSRHDSVFERLLQASPPPRDAALLVAGSTWPGDELLLLNAYVEVRARHPAARLLIVPHQPAPAVLERISRLAGALALPQPAASPSSSAPLLVDMTVGGLALTYRLGGLAYVGGGFTPSGPHSVLEPAATGAPVVIGPRHTTQEALQLEAAGGLVRLDPDGAIPGLVSWWDRFLQDPSAAAAAGAAARQVVEAGMGAAKKSVELIEKAGGKNG